MGKEQIQSIIGAIKEIEADTTISKNVKIKLDETVKALEEDKEISMKVDKAIHILDELSEDSNLPSYIRTQLWNILSLLETA